jgi:signal transduction histidine kinase/ActR/RegA family two-component response regulator
MERVLFRQRLFVVVAVAVLPLAVMSAIALYAGYQQQRAQAERAALDVARALSIAVEGELRRTIAVLEVLDDPLVRSDVDLKAFHAQARRLRESQPDWRSIVLHDMDGRVVVDTHTEFGSSAPPVIDRDSFDAAVRTRSAVIGYLVKGPRGYAFPVRVPIKRNNEVVYVLSAVVEPDAILKVMQGQRVPEGWVVAVADAKGVRVARTRSIEQSLGTPYSPSLVEMMRRSPEEGKGVTYNSEGDAVFTAYTRGRMSGWYTAVGSPTYAIEAGARDTFNTWGGGLALTLVIGVIAALVVARSVTRPMAKLRESALATRHGRAFERPDSSIREIDDVARALDEASRTRTELLESERHAREAAENASRAKDEFLAMLGHELRNPLSAISNASTLLESQQLSPEQSAHARAVIGRQVGHLTRLTDDLLDVGRALMGKIQLRPEPHDLAGLAAQSVATLRSAQRLREHRVLEQYQAVWVDCDPVRIDQVIANLVVNAVKYTPSGGTIRVSVEREGASALLRVADDGIGIAPELAERVFDLFVQGERELDRSQGGLGIGLTLVRSLARLHGGEVSVHSGGPGHGSEFTVRLPAIDAPRQSESPPQSAAPFNPRHILIVEDNRDAADTLKQLLEMLGHRVDTAHDGLSGLEHALALQPEVVLLDVGLPGMDGYEVARRIRAARGIHHPLIIAITGYGSAEDRARALDAGFDAHLTKPVDHAMLTALLERAPDAVA